MDILAIIQELLNSILTILLPILFVAVGIVAVIGLVDRYVVKPEPPATGTLSDVQAASSDPESVGGRWR